jgi:hypothetical protein
MVEHLDKKSVLEETYKGISYVLKLLQYSNDFGKVSSHMGVNGAYWVLENDNTDEEVKELAEEIGQELTNYYSNFLWEDSLHTWNDNKTLDELKEQMREVAHKEIDEFLDTVKRLDDKLQERTAKTNALKEKFKLITKNLVI